MRPTLALLSLLTLPLFAQQAVPTNAERLAAAAIASPQAWQTLSYLTDNIGARLSGSDQAARAVKWTTEQFRAWGIEVRNEPVMVPHWVRGIERGRLVSHDQNLVLTALGGSIATPAGGITADVVEVSSFEELKTLGRERIAGKIVYYNNPVDKELVRAGRSFDAYSKAVAFRGAGASRAAEYGAVAAVIRSVSTASLRTPHTGLMRYDPAQPKIPAAALSVEDAMLVHRLLSKKERVVMHLELTPQTLADVPSANVVAEIRGSERPDEIVLIGGHLDSWDLGTGAIDNGSGVTMVMETMRLIKALGLKPRRTIRAVLFMNEENGLRGGLGYFAAHKDEVAKHVATIESDAGVARPDYWSTTVKEDKLGGLRRIADPVLARTGAAKFEWAEDVGADTSPLSEAGVPGFGFVPDSRHYFDYHHSGADTLDKIDPADLAQDTACIAVLTWSLADSDVTLR